MENMWTPKPLTPAARKALKAIANGNAATLDLRYGPYSQLIKAGYITGEQGSPRITDAGRKAANV